MLAMNTWTQKLKILFVTVPRKIKYTGLVCQKLKNADKSRDKQMETHTMFMNWKTTQYRCQVSQN